MGTIELDLHGHTWSEAIQEFVRVFNDAVASATSRMRFRSSTTSSSGWSIDDLPIGLPMQPTRIECASHRFFRRAMWSSSSSKTLAPHTDLSSRYPMSS